MESKPGAEAFEKPSPIVNVSSNPNNSIYPPPAPLLTIDQNDNHGPYVVGYVMSREPIQGPPSVYDVNSLQRTIYNQPQQNVRVVPQQQTFYQQNAYPQQPSYTVPQQTFYQPSNAYNPQQAYSLIHTAPIQCPNQNDQHLKPNDSSVAILVTFILGMLFFIPHLVSIAFSLHLLRKGKIAKYSGFVMAASFVELSLWVICASLSWLYLGSNPNIYWDDWHIHYMYWGYIVISVWWIVSLGFGISRVVLCWKVLPDGITSQDPSSQSSRGLGYRIACLITYIFGFFFFIPELLSIIFSLVLLKKGHIVQRRGVVMMCVALELTAWILAISMSWLYGSDCNGEFIPGYTPPSYGWFSIETGCVSVYWGWIFLVFYGAVTISFGIPRVIYSWRQGNQCNRADYQRVF